MSVTNKIEEHNAIVLKDLYTLVARTMDYVSVKNNDLKLLSVIVKSENSSIEENTQLSLDVMSSIISKQIRNKFSI